MGELLSSLDNKVDLGSRINETLEDLARAVFKSWFLDFDPVRAKMEGRAPDGASPATAELFSDSFNTSPVGKLPLGWDVRAVGDEFDLTMGQSPPGDTYNGDGEGLPLFQGSRDFGWRYPTRRVYCTEPTRLAKAGDTLVSVRAPVGDVNMASHDCCVGRGVASIRHKLGGRSYTYYAMQNLREAFVEFEARGTVFGSMTKRDFLSIPCVAPPAEIVTAFEALVSPLDELVEDNWRVSELTTELSDLLLPRLVSGELRLGDLASVGF